MKKLGSYEKIFRLTQSPIRRGFHSALVLIGTVGLLEVVIYAILGLVFMIYALQGTPLTQVMGEFAVFGVAAMRLLPSVSKVVSHPQLIKLI